MHISIVVPLWAIIGFGVVAYPSIGIMVGRYLVRGSQGRLPEPLVALLSILWPATLAVSVAVFPLWFLGWVLANYNRSIQGLLSGARSEVPRRGTVVGARVKVKGHIADDGQMIRDGCFARVLDYAAGRYKLDFRSCGFEPEGVRWVDERFIV